MLRIQFVDGQLLKSTELTGKMQNYVKINVIDDPSISPNQQFRTKIVQGSAKTKKEENRIAFNDVVDIPLRSPNARLLIRIMDQDMTSDDICSQGYFNVNACGALTGQQNYYKVYTYLPVKEGKPVVANSGGDITFVAQYM